MKTGLLVVFSIILSILNYCYIKRDSVFTVDKKLNIKGLKPQGAKQIFVYALISITIISVALTLDLFYELNIFVVLKRLFFVAVLWSVAIVDMKEYRIPNNLLLIGLVSRVVVLVFELIFNFDMILPIIVNDGVALVFSIIICVACRLLSKGSLGMGDVKLLMLSSIMLGVEGFCYVLFSSVIFSSIVATSLLVFKRKKKKDVIPFAPFILLGTITSLIISGV
ncbi:MAG: prepilin peptidase [Clostridia bacterium]|nr:prepilin peptidase [Clostridia bacterium]